MRLPPESFPVVIAAVGALALGVGAVAALDGNLWGIPLALGGAWLLWWSVRVTRIQTRSQRPEINRKGKQHGMARW